MKALTLWQPWASLVAHGAKPYEFRGWRVPRRIVGLRIAIHAGARRIRRVEVEDLIADLQPSVFDERVCLHPEKAMEVLNRWHDLPHSCIVCTAVIGEAVTGLAAARAMGATLNDSDRGQHFNWGWPLTDIEPVPNIPARGHQGFWDWEGA